MHATWCVLGFPKISELFFADLQLRLRAMNERVLRQYYGAEVCGRRGEGLGQSDAGGGFWVIMRNWTSYRLQPALAGQRDKTWEKDNTNKHTGRLTPNTREVCTLIYRWHTLLHNRVNLMKDVQIIFHPQIKNYILHNENDSISVAKAHLPLKNSLR